MKFLLFLTVFLTLTNAILFLLGQSGKKKAIANNISFRQKGYPFRLMISIGYGVLRVFPFIAGFKEIKLRRKMLARDKNLEYGREHWNAVLANLFAGILFLLQVAALLVYVILKYMGGDPSVKNYICAILMTILVIPWYSIKKLYKGEKQRIEEMVDELPNLINKMLVFMNTGMPMNQVIEKIAASGINNPLYEEFRIVHADVSNGLSLKEALIHMKERCSCAEFSHFYIILEQNISKGSRDCNLALTELCLNLWNGRSERVKRKGALVQGKLMIPALIMMCVVFAIVVVPTFITLKGM